MCLFSCYQIRPSSQYLRNVNVERVETLTVAYGVTWADTIRWYIRMLVLDDRLLGIPNYLFRTCGKDILVVHFPLLRVGDSQVDSVGSSYS